MTMKWENICYYEKIGKISTPFKPEQFDAEKIWYASETRRKVLMLKKKKKKKKKKSNTVPHVESGVLRRVLV